jgi:alpha-glucosidase
MRHILISCILLASITALAAGADSAPETVASPDGRVVVAFHLNENGQPRYAVELAGQPALAESQLGLVRDDTDFTWGLKLTVAPPAEPVHDHYEVLTCKRRINDYRANRREFHLETAAGRKLDIIFQVSDDGVAFRYRFPETDATVHELREEVTSFHFLPGTRAWLQPIAVAKEGWHVASPSYEEYYEQDIPAGTPSPTGAGWVYPALFRTGDTWLLVSEAGLGRTYCGTRLRAAAPGGDYQVGFADPREVVPGGTADPESTLPWTTPWRLIVIGSLKTVAESMLGVDLAAPAAQPADASIQPGKASWSWPLLKDDDTTYDVQKRFIDYAASMGWRYTLIDAGWDQKIGYDRAKELVDYARTQGVKILLWYNSAGAWNSVPLTPRDKLATHAAREAEFARLKAMGVAGLKIDFFGGDGQSMIDYYLDLLHDAAPYGFLMNFHGATLPRGWERTYPHLMTMEAVRGLEYVTFAQANADQEATHAAMLPFTRNVFDPMDFTPMVLDRIPNIERRTTSAFELALSVLFTSGIQHYGEIPEGMAKAPDYVRDFLRRVPSVWDDVRFLDGFPGRYVVLARQGDGRWYVAGINAGDAPKALALDLDGLAPHGTGTLITDGAGGNLSFARSTVTVAAGKKLELTLPAHGGFVLVLE